MITRNLYYLILVALSTIFFSSTGFTAECSRADYLEVDYRTMLDEFYATDCFQMGRKSSPLAKTVRSLLDSDSNSQTQRALNALTQIQVYIKASYSEPHNLQFNNATALDDAISVLLKQINEHPQSPQEGLKETWKPGSDLNILPSALKRLDFTGALLPESRCPSVENRQCDDEFNSAANLLHAIYLVNAALDKYTEKFRAETLAERSIRRAKWDSYYDDLTFQYPWELLANNLVLERYDSRAKEDGNKKGFRGLPRSKLVILHPEANLVYAENAQDEYEITLTFEAIGFETFDFNEKGKVTNARGISLLAAYMDQANQANSGWTAGLLFKYDGYSLGVTDNHGDTGIVFNINLSQKIFDVKEESRKYYDKYQGKIKRLGKLVDEAGEKLETIKETYQISE